MSYYILLQKQNYRFSTTTSQRNLFYIDTVSREDSDGKQGSEIHTTEKKKILWCLLAFQRKCEIPKPLKTPNHLNVSDKFPEGIGQPQALQT